MVTLCAQCERPIDPKRLQLNRPPLCERCAGRPINERVRFDDRADETPLKERELRECS